MHMTRRLIVVGASLLTSLLAAHAQEKQDWFKVYESFASENAAYRQDIYTAYRLFKARCPSLFDRGKSQMIAIDLNITKDWGTSCEEFIDRCRTFGWTREVVFSVMLQPPSGSGRAKPTLGDDVEVYWMGGGERPGMYTLGKRAADACGWKVDPPGKGLDKQIDSAFVSVPQMRFLTSPPKVRPLTETILKKAGKTARKMVIFKTGALKDEQGYVDEKTGSRVDSTSTTEITDSDTGKIEAVERYLRVVVPVEKTKIRKIAVETVSGEPIKMTSAATVFSATESGKNKTYVKLYLRKEPGFGFRLKLTVEN